MKKVSIKDIAKDLNVSITTVSLVMNGKGDEKRISQDTQKKIIDYAEKLHYIPNIFAKGLKKGRSGMIGLIIPNISDVFYARIASRIEKEAAKQGYTVIYSSSEENPERESELIRSMLDRQVEGLIIASTQKNEDEIQELKRMKFPFVLVDRHYPNIETDYVIVDNEGGVRSAVNHLIKYGAKKIGFVTLEPGLDAIENRLQGYKNALDEHGISFNAEYVRELGIGDYAEGMYKALDHLLGSEIGVDSVIFSTHYLTRCGIRVLRSIGKRIPDDLKIISYDEFSAFDLLEPPITVVSQPVLDIGDNAVEILLDKINTYSEHSAQVVLDTGFIARKSCGE